MGVSHHPLPGIYVRCKQCAQVYHAYGVRTGGVQFRSRRSYAQVYHAYVCYQLCVQRHLCALSSFHCLRFVQITNNRQRHTYVRHNDRKHQRCDQHVLDVFLSFLTSSEIRFLPVPFTYYVSQLRTHVCIQKLNQYGEKHPPGETTRACTFLLEVHKLAHQFPLQGGTTLADSQNQLHGRCHLGM